MAYTTANGVTDAQAVEYHEAARVPGGGSALRLETTLRRAERIVAELAPPPEPADAEYTAVAADAELAVFEWLWETAAYLERNEVLDSRVVYRDPRALEDLVRREMGGYYVGPREVAPREAKDVASTVLTNVSDEPLW